MPTAEWRSLHDDGASREGEGGDADVDVDIDESDDIDDDDGESRRVSSSPSPTAGADVESHDDGEGCGGEGAMDDDGSRDSSFGSGYSGVDGAVVSMGELSDRMDPTSGRCWSCLVRLRPASGDCDRPSPPPPPAAAAAAADTSSSVAPRTRRGPAFLYSTHTHPLLDIAVCSVCEERASAVESDVVDAELPGGDGRRGDLEGEEDENNATENACSWCGLEDDELGEHDVRDDIPCSDLLLCDSCPRAFCVRCVILSRGGDTGAWEAVRRHCATATTSGLSGSSGSGKDDEDEEEWKCPHCRTTPFLEELRDAHARASSCGGDVATAGDDCVARQGDDGTTRNNAFGGGGGAIGDGDAVRRDDDGPDGIDDDGDLSIRGLLEELDYAEDSMEEATRHLNESRIDRERIAIELELAGAFPPPEDAEREARAELDRYLRGWRAHVDRLGDTIARLHEELDSIDVGVMEGYYRYRRQRDGGRPSSGGGPSRDRMALEDYKISADLALERRDAREGFSKGEFRGASGYKPKDPRVLKLEPEDLNDQCLNEIEDVNTLEGAITQMQSNVNERNPWRSKTGTTELDIEMFRSKAVEFEKISLGDLIDLDLLERRCITDKDDAMATKMEDAMEVRRTGSTRVVKRSVPLRAQKVQVRKESTESRLAGDKPEYQPRLPRQNDDKMTAAVPKAKKRAELQRLTTKVGSNAADSGRLSPTMRGLLIGDDTVEYRDSNFKLEVKNCTSKVTVCQSLATLLKEHQKEGLQFCWRNVCSKIMNLREEGNDEIHGAILAHNMGLGKTFQAVCLLHTLLTHPSLIRASGRRIIRTALLIAPVNTLANWETEFQKWVGTSSGRRKIPGILFYSWNDHKSKTKEIVKEWNKFGGILCVSTEKYASACKGYLDSYKRNINSKKKSTAPVEDDGFLRKALFNPGPDIVVLDEVHRMLKSNSTNIYKVLCGLSTRLRLGLTGSPIQNNLYEYYRMASWVSPGCLDTEAHFTKTFHDPIMDGMAADCSPAQAEKQEQVSNAMHSILSKFVHRRDADVLARDLPFLQETIIHVRQSKVQTKLYREFRKHQSETDNKNFFKQYHALRPVSNHPAVKIIYEDKRKSRPDSPLFSESTEDDVCIKVDNQNQPRVAPSKFAWICDKCNIAKFRTFEEAEAHEDTCDSTYNNIDTNPDDVAESTIPSKKGDSENEDWWTSFAERAEKSDLDIKAIEHGGKIVLLLQIIAHCDLIGDKVVVFSQSLTTLSFIEEILNSPDWGGFKLFLPDNIRKQKLGGWRRNQEYLRIDGSVDAKDRGDLIDTFHSDTAAGIQSKLFLLSTNAGGLGINLIAANRVVLFDSHWNPAVDLQAVYRCYRYGQTKPTFCYRLLAEGTMEQKIYSRAAAKTSLSDLVIDQTNPERSFTKQEMDLLRVEDTWVSCNACNKWRMLPPDISAEEVERLPDEWYCKDNIWDPSRSKCSAEERNASWMFSFFERRAREEDDAYVASQGSLSSYCEKVTADVRPAFDRKHQEYTERDTVLQNLIDRSEDKAANTSDNASSGKKTWVSKWDFNFDKSEKLESTGEKQEQEPPIKTNSPNKMKILKSPTKMKLLKSPTKMSPPKTHKTKSERNKPQSPYEKIHTSPPGSSGKKRKHRKPFDKSERSKPHSPNKEMHKLPPGSSGSSGKQRKDKPLDKWQKGKTGQTDDLPPSERGSSGKKRKLEKSAEKSEARAETKKEGPNPPHVKKKKDKDDYVVDLTFSDSDCA